MSKAFKTYVKRRAESIEAVQFNPHDEWPECVKPWPKDSPKPRDMSWGFIETQDGKLNVLAGDWIVKGNEDYHWIFRGDLLERYQLADDN